MTVNSDIQSLASQDQQSPNRLRSLCAELSLAGQVTLQNISSAIKSIAPEPGDVVYMHARRLSIKINGLEPVIFTAIDVSTHLQVAQGYLGRTTAAAISFFEFATQEFPFSIADIKTPDEPPFHESLHQGPHRGFSDIMQERGALHTLIADQANRELFSILERMFFGRKYSGSLSQASSYDFQRELGQFLFFYNNYRCVPWFGGKTPVQRLRTFTGFSGVHSFGSCGELELEHVLPPSGHAQSKSRQRHAVQHQV